MLLDSDVLFGVAMIGVGVAVIGVGVSVLGIKDRLLGWRQVLLTERPGEAPPGATELERDIID